MQADWVFLAVAAAFALAVAGAMIAPLLAGRAGSPRRASYDMQVYRDQLREVEADAARGVLTPVEAEATRVEIARRLLAAADAETREDPAGMAPRGVSRAVGVALAVAVVAGGAWLYASIGGPGRPDQPRAARLAALDVARASRPGQAEVEAIIAERGLAEPEIGEEERVLLDQLATLLATRPDDIDGRRILVQSEVRLGRFARARAAQERIVEVLGDAAGPQERVDLAEFMILAANGYVSPEAEAMLGAVLATVPEHPVARYYSGLALLQGGRPDLALDLWARLLNEGPQDAPWVIQIASQIDAVAAAAGRPAPPVPRGGPVIDPLATPEQAAMIEGMVEGLSARLATEGGPPEDWAQLIRSLGVLGRGAQAAAIWAEAREVFAADPVALDLLADTARGVGLGQ